jgi:hypothetical protein
MWPWQRLKRISLGNRRLVMRKYLLGWRDKMLATPQICCLTAAVTFICVPDGIERCLKIIWNAFWEACLDHVSLAESGVPATTRSPAYRSSGLSQSCGLGGWIHAPGLQRHVLAQHASRGNTLPQKPAHWCTCSDTLAGASFTVPAVIQFNGGLGSWNLKHDPAMKR